MGRMLKGDEAPVMIAVLIFVFALAFVFMVLGVKYTNFQAGIDKDAEIRMEAIDNLHLVRSCMAKGTNDIVDESKLNGCVLEWTDDDWRDEFDIGIGSPDKTPIHSVYVSTTEGELKEIYVKRV